jgi:hypothetical protein
MIDKIAKFFGVYKVEVYVVLFVILTLLILSLTVYQKSYLNASYEQIKALKQELNNEKTLNNQYLQEIDKIKEKFDDVNVLKNTPMDEARLPILKSAKKYNLPIGIFTGIAFAESGFKNFKCFNPFGMSSGLGKDIVCYDNWDKSVDRFGYVIKNYYFDEGKITAKQIVEKYVGYKNNNWVNNVNYYYE